MQVLSDPSWTEEKEPPLIRPTLELFQRQHWEHFSETGWSVYGLSQSYFYFICHFINPLQEIWVTLPGLGPSHATCQSVGFFQWCISGDTRFWCSTCSVWGLCRSAACSYLCCLESETHDAWNRADPIFDAWCLVLTNQSKHRGELLRPYRSIKNGQSQWGLYFKAKPFFFHGPFLHFQHRNINTSGKTTQNYHLLHWKTCWM